MNRIRAFGALPVLIISLLALPAVTDAQTGLTRSEIDRISRAVVQINAHQRGEAVSSGSGTIVSPNGRIYTNRHVVEESDDYEILILEDVNELPVSRYRARLVGYSMDVDFAILQIDRDSAGRPLDSATLSLPSLAVEEPDVQRGDPVYVFGYPGIGDGYLTFTTGVVTTIRNGTLAGERMATWYMTEAEISPGNSGGLAVNGRSQFVGLPTAVRFEQGSFGRMGGLLAIGAAQAAIELGLATDRTAMQQGTTSPVIEGGRLDFNQPAHFGAIELVAGFVPDPHEVAVTSGGEVAVSYLGSTCVGYAAQPPDYRLTWGGNSSQLRIFFLGDEGGDTTLIVNRPDGTWVCNDDVRSGVRDPMIVFESPTTGRYDIWVGSYRPGEFVSGALVITERTLDPETAR